MTTRPLTRVRVYHRPDVRWRADHKCGAHLIVHCTDCGHRLPLCTATSDDLADMLKGQWVCGACPEGAR